jgi:transcriptional regulator with XRE-family HTH domain
MNRGKAASAAYVRALLEKSNLPRNQIAAISGLSNAYIRVLEKGDTASVGREKLISFGLALNLSLTEIDELLQVFDRSKLSKDDIPIFFETSKQIKISSALHPLRDVYVIELMYLRAEQIPGHQITVNDRPSTAFRPEGHRTYSDKSLVKAHPIYSELIEQIGRERKRNLLYQLTRNAVEHYIFRDSLEGYVRSCNDREEKRCQINRPISCVSWVSKLITTLVQDQDV